MRLEAIRTPCTREAFAGALVRGWWRLLQTPPSRESILLLATQSALETRKWLDMLNNNVGNAKHVPTRKGDWFFTTCSENLDPARADHLLSIAEPRSDDPTKLNVELGPLRTISQAGKPDRIVRHVTFHPDHAASAFRGFLTLDAGVRDHLSLLCDVFAPAWPHVLSGDVRAFAEALHAARYYTADPAHYAGELVKIRKEFDSIPIDLSPPPADTTGALEAVQSASLESLSAGLITDSFRDRG